MIPLSKTYDPADFGELAEQVAIVDKHLDGSQHGIRKWEYAMAIAALDRWLEGRQGAGTSGSVIDVGGHGSPFWKMIGDSTIIVDPREGTGTLAEYLAGAPRLSQAVFCLSVLEHVDDLRQFCYHLSCLVAPGGLLFLTFDYQPGEEPDEKMFHWDRKRIFNPRTWIDLADSFCGDITYAHGGRDFHLLGMLRSSYHGPFENWGYAAASLALIKRR